MLLEPAGLEGNRLQKALGGINMALGQWLAYRVA